MLTTTPIALMQYFFYLEYEYLHTVSFICFSKFSSESWVAVVKPKENAKHIPVSVNGSVCAPLRIVWKTWIRFRYDTIVYNLIIRTNLSWIPRNVWLHMMKTYQGKIYVEATLSIEEANFIAYIATSTSSIKRRWMIIWPAKFIRRSRYWCNFMWFIV